jgi:prepilin-type N-terminal cleavage/methylation domain-containing protein
MGKQLFASRQHVSKSSAFTLVEVLVAMLIFGVTAVAVMTGIRGSITAVGMAREQNRATQILTEKLETLRLYEWAKITNGTFLPASMTVNDYHGNGSTSQVYRLTIQVTKAPMAANYSNDLARVTLGLRWTTGQIPRERTVSTLIYRKGLQTYVY